jgi:predicted nucleic acid-binding protein
LSVLDAAAVVDALAVAGPKGDAARAVVRAEPIVQAPAILKAEAVSALRGLERRGAMSEGTARAALSRLRRLVVRPHQVDPFVGRIWELRHTLSVYDAWYVALSEELGTDLVTTDQRLATAPGPRCPITVVTG